LSFFSSLSFFFFGRGSLDTVFGGGNDVGKLASKLEDGAGAVGSFVSNGDANSCECEICNIKFDFGTSNSVIESHSQYLPISNLLPESVLALT
jgi:hypothetical protein